jgi:hypothetical protein
MGKSKKYGQYFLDEVEKIYDRSFAAFAKAWGL